MAVVYRYIWILTLGFLFFRSPDVLHSQDSFPSTFRPPFLGDILSSGRCRCVRCRGSQRTESESPIASLQKSTEDPGRSLNPPINIHRRWSRGKGRCVAKTSSSFSRMWSPLKRGSSCCVIDTHRCGDSVVDLGVAMVSTLWCRRQIAGTCRFCCGA